MRCLGVPTATSAELGRELPRSCSARGSWLYLVLRRAGPPRPHRERNLLPCVARREQAVLLWAWCLLLSVDDEIRWFPVWVHRGRSDVWQGCPVEGMNLLCHEVELACAGELPGFLYIRRNLTNGRQRFWKIEEFYYQDNTPHCGMLKLCQFLAVCQGSTQSQFVGVFDITTSTETPPNTCYFDR